MSSSLETVAMPSYMAKKLLKFCLGYQQHARQKSPGLSKLTQSISAILKIENSLLAMAKEGK